MHVSGLHMSPNDLGQTSTGEIPPQSHWFADQPPALTAGSSHGSNSGGMRSVLVVTPSEALNALKESIAEERRVSLLQQHFSGYDLDL